MNPENYIVIQGWMVSELNLSGNDLLAYSVIHGFSQDGQSEFTGSINYLCSWLNCSRPTVIKSLNSLVEKEFISKKTEVINGVTFNKYRSLRGVKNLDGGSKESLLGGSKESLLGGSKDSLPNKDILYTDILYTDNNKDSIKQKSFKEFSLEDFKEDISKHKSDYGSDMLNSFYLYWIERDSKGKMRFQRQDTWETNLRLATWDRNNKNKQVAKPVNIFRPEPNKAPNPLELIRDRVTHVYKDAELVKMGSDEAKSIFWYIEKKTPKEFMNQAEKNFHLYYY
jgi:hypothetical protein